MKKSLIAIAVSSVAFTATSVQAEKFDVYGNIQLAYTIEEAASDDETEFGDNGSTFGFKGEKELKDGLVGFFKYELEAAADEKTDDVTVNLDQAYVGVKGGFGKVQVGSFDSIYNNAIQDNLDQFEVLGIANQKLTEEGDTIAYFSPSFGGVELQLSAQTKGNQDKDGGESGTAITSVVKYSADNLSVAFGYDSVNNVTSGDEVFGFDVTYAVMPSTSVSAKYETAGDDIILGVAARSAYSAGSVYGSFATLDFDSDATEDYDEFGVGVTYNLDTEGDVFVYAELGQTGADENNTTALGATYVF